MCQIAFRERTKAGLQALNECLWYEARLEQIRVIDFRPLSLDTEFHERAGRKPLRSGGSSPARAAADLFDFYSRGGEFVYYHGYVGKVLQLASRILPRSWMIRILAGRSFKAGYLGPNRANGLS